MKLILEAILWLLQNAKINTYGNMDTIQKIDDARRDLIIRIKAGINSI